MTTVGRMREQITIRRRTEVKNPRGGLDLSWSTLAEKLWAEVINLDGREAFIGNVMQGISSFRVTVRFRSDLKVSDQILWLGRMVAEPVTGSLKPMELNIRSAEDKIGTRKWLTIIATSEAPQGA